MTSPGNYHFYIVNRFDSLIFEGEFLKTNLNALADKKVKILIIKFSYKKYTFEIYRRMIIRFSINSWQMRHLTF